MALGQSSIDRLSLLMNTADTNLKAFREELFASIDELHGNTNYNIFIENTEIGKELNDKLLKLRDVGTDTASSIEKLLNITVEFKERQKSLNVLGQIKSSGIDSLTGGVQ